MLKNVYKYFFSLHDLEKEKISAFTHEYVHWYPFIIFEMYAVILTGARIRLLLRIVP